MRFTSLCLCLTALALSGCAGNNVNLDGFAGGTASPKPKTIVVSDFVVAQDVPAIDRGFSTRQESKGGNFPLLERRQRTLERVNDEVLATIVVSLREAGLDAEPAEGAVLKEGAVRLSGRLHAPEQGKRLSPAQLGFGQGRGRVVADMALSQTGFGKHSSFDFSVDLQNGFKPLNGKAAAAHNEAIAAVLATEGADPEKLSPDVEGQARRLGGAVAQQVIAYAKEQGWTIKSDNEAPSVGVLSKKTEKKPAQKPTT